MADSSFLGSNIFNVTGTFPFTNNHYLNRIATGSSPACQSGSFEKDNSICHHIDSFSSGVVEQITIVGHEYGVPFYVERHILVTSGILPA